MQITLNITEDSKVELVKDSCELVQGECCFTDFVFNLPATIKGHAISEYTKYIEFGECKELGECVKFVDEIKGNTYELNEMCTAFKKIAVQIVLERNTDGKMIVWKTVPFTLEFVESVNANGDIAIQSQLLHLTEIRDEWASFIKANCLRMVYSSAGVPLANEESEGDTIFYLGDNTSDFTYGHYYRCTLGAWRDLTQDPSLEGVANGVREINKSRTVQMFIGTQEEILNKPHGENEIIIAEDMDTATSMTELLTAMAGDNTYIRLNNDSDILTFRTDENGVLKIGGVVIPQRKVIWENTDNVLTLEKVFDVEKPLFENGKVYEIEYKGGIGKWNMTNGCQYHKFKCEIDTEGYVCRINQRWTQPATIDASVTIYLQQISEYNKLHIFVDVDNWVFTNGVQNWQDVEDTKVTVTKIYEVIE